MESRKSTSKGWRLKHPLAALSAAFFAFSCAPLFAEGPSFDGFSIEIGDASYFQGFSTLTPMAKNRRERLTDYPDVALIWRDDTLFIEREGQKTRISGAVPVSEWWPSVSWADIDFDGKPEFFIIEQDAMQGSIYRLLSAQGVSPASLFKPPPASLVASKTLLFKDGRGPEPAFFGDGKALEFYSRLGPYYTTELWRWDGSAYGLAEQRRAIYSPEIDNAPMAFMERLRFDEQGASIGVTCHPARTANFAPLRYRAFLPIPLRSAPSGKAAALGILKPGASFEIVGYDKSDEDDIPLLWLKATEIGGDRTGWVSLDLIQMEIDGETLIAKDPFNPLMADYMNRPARIIGETMTERGMETLVRHGDDPPFSLPLDKIAVIPYERRP